MVAVDVGRLGGHRRVEVERQERDLAALDEAVQLPDDLLRPADGERRDEQDAVRVGDHPDRLGQDPDRLGLRLVHAPAVGRLDEDVVGVVHRRRVAQDRRARPAEVARADDDPLLGAIRIGHAEADDRRAEDVPGVLERGEDARRDLDLLAVAERPELGDGDLGVVGRVERQVEVDIELGRLGAQVRLGIARPRPRRARNRLDRRLDVFPGRIGRRGRRPRRDRGGLGFGGGRRPLLVGRDGRALDGRVGLAGPR